LAASGRLGFAPSRARRVRNVLRSQAGSRIPRGPLFIRKITFLYDGRAQTCLPKFREVNIAPFPSGERSLKGRDANALLFRGLGNRVFRDPSSPNAAPTYGSGMKTQNQEKNEFRRRSRARTRFSFLNLRNRYISTWNECVPGPPLRGQNTTVSNEFAGFYTLGKCSK